MFRWVPADAVPELYRQLAAAGMGLPDAGTIADVTSCPGAESCKLAVTQSRGLGRFLGDHLREHPELVAAAPDLQIKISGCPNGCGRHHIAGLGFQGSVRKLGGKAIPQYFVMVGGGPEGDGVRFARLAAKIPARRMTEALERLIDLYLREREHGRVRDVVLHARGRAARQDGARRPRADDAGHDSRRRFRRSGRNPPVQSRSSGRRMLGVIGYAHSFLF